MRHPFWQWSGWLSIGLTGCLHGQDWRAAVMRPATRTVADLRESAPHPKVDGAFRSRAPKFVPQLEVSALAVVEQQSAQPNQSRELSEVISRPATGVDAPQDRPTQAVTLVGGNLSATNTVIPSLAIVALPLGGSYAEYERTIPVRRQNKNQVSARPAETNEVPVAAIRTPEGSTDLPVIIPAGTVRTVHKPAGVRSDVQSVRSDGKSATGQPPGPLSSSAVLAKELPDVTDIETAQARGSSTREGDSSRRVQDVSALVEQVFEDLRHRRLIDARKRTEWLKQLVMRRSSASSSAEMGSATSVEIDDDRTGAPPRLRVDLQATAVKKPLPIDDSDGDGSSASK